MTLQTLLSNVDPTALVKVTYTDLHSLGKRRTVINEAQVLAKGEMKYCTVERFRVTDTTKSPNYYTMDISVFNEPDESIDCLDLEESELIIRIIKEIYEDHEVGSLEHLDDLEDHIIELVVQGKEEYWQEYIQRWVDDNI